MKILIIGSTQYKERMEVHVEKLEKEGHVVALPAFDDYKELDALGVCKHNRSLLEQADEIHVIWDQRSFGTIFDLGMAFALRKKLRVIFLEPKTFAGVMRKWEEEYES